MFLSLKSAWESGKSHETDWWLRELRQLFSTKSGAPEFESWVRGTNRFGFDWLTSDIAGEEIKVLDIGSGPMTQVGLAHPAKRIVVTAVDPLADDYAKILADVGIKPAVRTIRGEAEKLDELFDPNMFDFAHCRNALDHSYDPLTGISQVMRVLKPGAALHLTGHRNEGESVNYGGLHQWNFEVSDGQAIIWRPGIRINVAEALKDEAELVKAEGKGWYMITLRKRGRRFTPAPTS